jgi:hypothetical protein
MKKNLPFSLPLAALLALPASGAGTSNRCVAVMPLTSDSSTASQTGWDKASEGSSSAKAGCVIELDWETLGRILGGEAPLPQDLHNPALMRRVGLLVSADQVVSRFYSRKGGKAMKEAMLVDVATGKVSRMRLALKPSDRQKTVRDLDDQFYGTIVEPAATVARVDKKSAARKRAFGIDPNDVAMRDAPSDSACSSAQGRVDRIEREVLDLKARQWAAEIRSRGTEEGASVMEAGMSDAGLRKDFQTRVNYWTSQEDIPALSKAESRRVEDAESRAIALIRSCNLPK